MSQSRPDSRMPTFAAACVLACCLAQAQPADAGATQWVDVEIANGWLLIDTEIAGIPGKALIDTGAQINGINRRFLEAADLSFEKGRPVKITGVHSTAYRDVYNRVPVSIFGTEVVFRDVVEGNMGPPEMQMSLGAGFLQLFIFQLDYPNERMRVITRDSLDLKKLKNVESKKDSRGGSPIVKVRLNDEKDVWLIMDTGSNGGVLLERKLAKKQGWLDRYPTVDGISVGSNSSGRMQRFNLPTMTFGPFDIADTSVSVPAEGAATALFEKRGFTGSRIKRNPRKSQGLLGYDVLKHFVVTIDYKTGYVHIEPGANVE